MARFVIASLMTLVGGGWTCSADLEGGPIAALEALTAI
jgi:hypothetical protein